MWEATFLEGEKRGSKIKTSAANFTKEKWLIANESHKYAWSWEDGTAEQEKQSALHFMELRCNAMLHPEKDGS